MKKSVQSGVGVLSILLLAACGGGDRVEEASVENYVFSSKFIDGQSAVSYSGQTARHVLISQLKNFSSNLAEDDGANYVPDLEAYYSSDRDGQAHGFTVIGSETVIPGPNYEDISSGKQLQGKIAGNDPALLSGGFFGWELGTLAAPGTAPTTPDELLAILFERLNDEATNNTVSLMIDVAGSGSIAVNETYIDADGRDYAQLIQKFLLGAVTFSQGVADYLQTDFNASNAQEDATDPYTEGAHNWDEAFGYFGAARNYLEYSDDEIAAKDGRDGFSGGYNDANTDGSIDLKSEYNFGNAVNCAKRDRGSITGTDFTQQAYSAFYSGRKLLNDVAGDGAGSLTATQLDELNGYIKTAAVTWEKCIAATVVHYINDVISDMSKINASDEYEDLDHFKDLVKHWGEMKGFALGLQFNPESPFRDAEVTSVSLTDLQNILLAMGDAPVLAEDGVSARNAYALTLVGIRSNLQMAYSFADDDVINW